MQKNGGDVVQAVPLLEGKINVGAGDYTARCLIHCETDAVISLPFPSGVVTYNMVTGDDRGYVGDFTVVSGTVTYD